MKSQSPLPLGARSAPLSNARLGMILFIASEAMLFGGLMAGYVVFRFGSGNFAGTERPPIGLPGLATLLMLFGSAALIAAGRSLRRGETGRFRLGTLGAILFGAIALGLEIIAWRELAAAGMTPASSLYGGIFYILSWVHAAHLLGGLALLAVSALRTHRAGASGREGGLPAAAALYWHFVTLVWLGLFIVLLVV